MSATGQLPRILYIGGPTAVGKSALALGLAEALDAEIVNADSVQLYRGLDIGSAKARAADRARVRHHLLDVLDPDEPNNVADFVEMALEAIASITSRGKRAIVTGGTGLYLRVLVHGIFDAPPPDESIRARHRALHAEHGPGYLHERLGEVDAALADKIHPNDIVRVSRGLEVFEQTGRRLSELQREHAFKTPNVEALKVALHRPRPELYARIASRVEIMLEAGFVEEVRGLRDLGFGRDLKPMQSLGYAQLMAHLAGELTAQEAEEAIVRETKRYARRQLNWLRSERDVHWARAPLVEDDGQPPQGLLEDLERFFDASDEPLELSWTSEPPSQ